MDDPLKKLLDQTGWSYEDVLKRLEQYKQTNVIKTSEKNNDCDNLITNNAQNAPETDGKEGGIDSTQTIDTDLQELTTAHNRRKRKLINDELTDICVVDGAACTSKYSNEYVSQDNDSSQCKEYNLSCASQSNNKSITDRKKESVQDEESSESKRIKVSSSSQSNDTDVDGGADLDSNLKESECGESSISERTKLFCSSPKSGNNICKIEEYEIREKTDCKDSCMVTSSDENERVSKDGESFDCNNITISSNICQNDHDEKMELVHNGTNICQATVGEKADLILEKSYSCVTSTVNTTNSDCECVTGADQSLDCKENTNASNSNIISDPEIVDRLESHKSNEDIKVPEQIEVENLELNNICDDRETTINCEKNDRLTGIDVTKEEVVETKENNNNNSPSTITKRRKSRRKSNLKNDIQNKLFRETIQDNICDNSSSTSSSMQNLTKSLNKRRKLTEIIDLDSDSQCSSVCEETIKVECIEECDNTSCRSQSETRELVDIKTEDVFTNKCASDETDSNKENTSLNFNSEEQSICDKGQNLLDEKLENKDIDTSSISYSSIVREDTFFNEAKSRYICAMKTKTKESSGSQLKVSDNIENINLHEEKNIPDFIEMLKQEVCNRFPTQEPKDKCNKLDEERSTTNDLEQPNTNNGDNQINNSDETDASNSRVEVGNITNMISKKLESCTTEDDFEKARSHESGSNSSSSCDQDNKDLRKHRRQHQILILKRKSGNIFQSNLKTFNSAPANSDASISSNTAVRPTGLLAKKETRKFNTDRLTNITNILSQKLSSINKDLDSKEESGNDELNLRIVDVVGGYKSPSPEFEPTYSRSLNKSYAGRKRSLNEDMQTTTAKNKVDQPTTSKRWKTALPNRTSLNSTDESSMLPPKMDTSATLQTQTNQNPIKPTKTKDVTKIKGWKKKKFAIESPAIKEKVESNNSIIDLSSILAGPSTAPSVSSPPEAQSVFTSSILEEFLSENSNLKISYEVPKLEAERTLQQTYTDIKFPKREGQQGVAKLDSTREKKDKKPKTVAEKRKLEERLPSRLLEDLLKLETPTPKHYTTMILKLKHKMLAQSLPFSRMALVAASKITNTESFVIYNNKKISVSSAKSNKVFCKIVHKEGVTQIRNARKLSLLQSLARNDIYDPDDWENVEKELPKVYLEVIPTIGKRLHPKVSHLIESNETMLNRQRVNFALSVLKTPDPMPPKRFLFRIPYQNNQKTVVLRKRIFDDVADVVTNKKVEIEESVDDTVRHVMNKMLDYVDVLDDTKDIVLEDDSYDVVSSKQVHTTPDKKIDKVTTIREFKRTELEMKRLNCKFVSISPVNEATMNKPCEKDHCRLGCVCNSLEGSVSNLLETHCGLYKCMFRCRCKREIIKQSNTFHEGIINRLQDEATKDLAKVEKEFTQTIIQTNNQLIVVGDSCERKRRVARAPKKYDDFVEETFFYEPIPKAILAPPVKSSKIIYKNFVLDKCYVKLFKYNFKNIIPFCWVHLLYKCQCVIESVPIHRPKGIENPVVTPIDRETKSKKSGDKLPTPTDREVKLKRAPSFDKEEHSSRTRGIPSYYYCLRNKSHTHLARLKKSSHSLERMLNKYLKENADDIMSPFENKRLNSDQLRLSKSNADEDSNSEINIVHYKETEPEFGISSQKIKSGKELKIQRRRQLAKAAKNKKVSQNNDSPPENNANQMHQSEKEFCMFLAKHNSQVRILPWSVLISRYENGSFQLWTINTPNAPVLLTENGRRPTLSHYNLKLFEHFSGPFNPSCDIIRYIIKKETPLGKSKDQPWVLFLEVSNNIWRICGMCEKNESKKDFSISIITLYGRLEDIIKESNDQFQEKIIVDGNKTITSSKKYYLPKKLIPIAVPNSEKIEHCVWSSVPNISSNCKWRVISLKIPFAHLSFSRCKYTIDFKDIMKAMELAQSSSLTLALRSDDLHMIYPHSKFGIYCDRLHPDKIFVGPYLDYENCDLTFLIRKGDSLIDSTSTADSRLIGSSFWYQQATPVEDNVEDDVQFIPDETLFVDLTNDSDNEQITNSASVDTDETVTNASEVDRSYKEKRYIVTNVPGVGYISATIDLSSNYLDITCPITLKVKTFLSVSAAIETLQRIMIRKFILVPLTFKLEVKMVYKVNSKKFKPLDSAILNGYHMVGDFGVKNASSITFDDLNRYGLSKIEILQVLEQRERKLLLLPLTALSKLLNVHIPNKTSFVSSLQVIAAAAQEEVDRLHSDEAKYIDQTFHLHNNKKALTKRCFELLVNLPPDQRKKEKKQLHAILKSYSPRVNKVFYETNKLLKPARNEVGDSENFFEAKNLFDEPSLKKTNEELLALTSLNTEVKPTVSRCILTRKPSKSQSSTKTSDEGQQIPTSVSKVTSSPSVNIPLVDIGKNLKLINNTILKQKQATSLLKPVEAQYILPSILNQILSGIPNVPGTATATSTTTTTTTTQTPKLPNVIKVPQNITPTTNVIKVPQNITPTTSSYTVVTLPTTGPIATVKIGKSTYLAHTNQQTATNCTKSSEITTNSMATLTPLLQNTLKNTAISSKNQNYIAVKDGQKMRYFKLSQKTPLKNKSAIKPITSTAKKIILSNLPTTNTDQKTGK